MGARQISRYMSRCPLAIDRKAPLAEAHRLMREEGIRHLPVVDAGRLVGMLSLHDLHLVETFRDVDVALVPVEDAMSDEVYAVAVDAPLSEVAAAMAERKLSSAIVMEENDVAGVFTTTDALYALSDLARL